MFTDSEDELNYSENEADAYLKGVAFGRREEMEACCRDICHDCRDGVKLNKVTEDEKGYYLHESPSGRVWMCWAYIIRQRWQQGQGQKKGAGE